MEGNLQIVEVSGAYASEAEFIRDAVREKLQQVSISEVRELSQKELEQQVIGYIKEHGRAYPSDVVADLSVPYFSVTSMINRLVEKGILEPAVGEST